MNNTRRRNAQSHVGIVRNPALDTDLGKLINHFDNSENKRALITLESAQQQINLMYKVAEGDSNALLNLRQLFIRQPNPSREYFTVQKDGKLVDMRTVTGNMSTRDADPHIVPAHYGVITGDSFAAQRIDNPLSALMNELLESGRTELAERVAKVGFALSNVEQNLNKNLGSLFAADQIATLPDRKIHLKPGQSASQARL